MALQPIVLSGPTTDRWPHYHLSSEMKEHPVSLGLTFSQHINFPAILGFLAEDYRYRSVATQIMLGYQQSPLPGIDPGSDTCQPVTMPLRQSNVNT